ncbi:Uncharacterised protein [Mycobacteroides abscessus subsp. abscessus]|nr:Uncharacterised protein [Mycobacteroides abscessus subsp. abscessus]
MHHGGDRGQCDVIERADIQLQLLRVVEGVDARAYLGEYGVVGRTDGRGGAAAAHRGIDPLGAQACRGRIERV